MSAVKAGTTSAVQGFQGGKAPLVVLRGFPKGEVETPFGGFLWKLETVSLPLKEMVSNLSAARYAAMSPRVDTRRAGLNIEYYTILNGKGNRTENAR